MTDPAARPARPLVFLETKSTDPSYNLAFEEYVFTRMSREKDYFMLWQNDKAVVVGCYQNTERELDRRFAEAQGIQVVRRISGGGAVYHDLGNLNYTFVTDRGDGKQSFSLLAGPVVSVLNQLGVPAQCNGRNDLTVAGKKFSGSAQAVRGARLLHHGTLMVDVDLEMMARVLTVPEAKIRAKGIASVRSRVTNLAPYFQTPLCARELGVQLRRRLSEEGGLASGELSEAQLLQVKALRDEKYAAWEWNYGSAPQMEIQKERKFPTGLVTVSMQANRGYIERIRFHGDFFGAGDLRELEARLEGCALSGELLERLVQCTSEHYIHGVSARELYELILY